MRQEDFFDFDSEVESGLNLENEGEDGVQEMFEHYRFDISSGQEPMRVDKYLSTHMEYTSRHRIQLAIKAEYIRVNEKIVKANYIIRPGDVIKFVMPYQRRGLDTFVQGVDQLVHISQGDVLLTVKPTGLLLVDGSILAATVGQCNKKPGK